MDNGLVRFGSILGGAGRRQTIRVRGIDLGTTVSTVTEVAWDGPGGGSPTCRCLELDQPTPDGVFTSPMVPSVVALLPSGETWVGEGAKRLRARPQEFRLVPERTLFFETKNEMGLRKSYYRAQARLDRPWKVAAEVLSALQEGAARAGGAPPTRTVVTVPASFQMSQRRDTLLAAERAGIGLRDHDLLDEPTAALLDYLVTHAGPDALPAGDGTRVLVFDFGGGTCDVAVVELSRDPASPTLDASLLATSRYHRLGGGDLDAAIVHEHLLPALLKENGLRPHDLGWAEKKKGLEPQLLGTAEALKVQLCRELHRLETLGPGAAERRLKASVRQPALTCALGSRAFTLSVPSLDATRWEEILAPFVDPEATFARETEYRLTQSVFSPVQDALNRAGLKAGEIHAVLLAGGSTLVPQVREAVRRFFPRAALWTFKDPLAAQLAVSRGAAWHAFFLEAFGRPFLAPVLGDTVALLTEGGEPLELVRAGTPVPFPPDGSFAWRDDLAVPSSFAREMRMEVVSLPGRQPLFSDTWTLARMAGAGEPIRLGYRVGANRSLELQACLASHPEERFAQAVENPLLCAVNPHPVRLKIEAIEEGMRERGGPAPTDRGDLLELARAYSELHQTERAVEVLGATLRTLNRPDGEVLNLQGIYYGELRDEAREEKAYRAAAEAEPGLYTPHFNLALLYRDRREPARALQAVDEALKRSPRSAPARALRADILLALGREGEAQADRKEAARLFGPPPAQSDWELGWCEHNGRQAGDEALLERIRAERSRRAKGGAAPPAEAPRPAVVGRLAKKESA